MLWWRWGRRGGGMVNHRTSAPTMLRFLWYTKTILPVIKTLAGRAHQTNYVFLRHNCCLFLCYLSTHLLIFSSTHSACLLPLNQKERTNTHICISLEQKGRKTRVFVFSRRFTNGLANQWKAILLLGRIPIVTKNVQYVYPNCYKKCPVCLSKVLLKMSSMSIQIVWKACLSKMFQNYS